mgnify:CR=1 FL=1
MYETTNRTGFHRVITRSILKADFEPSGEAIAGFVD